MEQLHDYRDTDFRYLEIVIQGKHFYGEFLDGRVARNTVPQNLVVYNIRADTDLDHIPVSVENYVDRDFYGTIISSRSLLLRSRVTLMNGITSMSLSTNTRCVA